MRFIKITNINGEESYININNIVSLKLCDGVENDITSIFLVNGTQISVFGTPEEFLESIAKEFNSKDDDLLI